MPHLQDDEKLIPRLSLHHNLLPVLKLHRLQCIGHRQALPLIQRLCRRRNMQYHQPPLDGASHALRHHNRGKKTEGDHDVAVIIILMGDLSCRQTPQIHQCVCRSYTDLSVNKSICLNYTLVCVVQCHLCVLSSDMHKYALSECCYFCVSSGASSAIHHNPFVSIT